MKLHRCMHHIETMLDEQGSHGSPKMFSTSAMRFLNYPGPMASRESEIKVKGQKLDTVTSFKYLGAVVSDDGSKPEVPSRIAQATAALTKLKPIWGDNNIPLGSKAKRSLVISIFLYVCESWTLTAELEKRTQAFEMRCYRRLLNISYKDHVTNEEVRRKIQAAIGEYDELLTLVKKRTLDGFAMSLGLLV